MKSYVRAILECDTSSNSTQCSSGQICLNDLCEAGMASYWWMPSHVKVRGRTLVKSPIMIFVNRRRKKTRRLVNNKHAHIMASTAAGRDVNLVIYRHSVLGSILNTLGGLPAIRLLSLVQVVGPLTTGGVIVFIYWRWLLLYVVVRMTFTNII